MERPRESRLSLELVRDLASREGVRAIVDGELTAVGASYILAVRLVTADSGRELASFRATAASPDSLIQMADELSRKLRSRIGESLQSVKASPPLERVTTSSLEALRKYSAAVQAADVEGNRLRAAQLFREAVAIDTLFAEGWRRLGLLLSNMTAPPGAADSALSKAYLLRDRLREIDAERVTATYFAAGSRADRSKAIPAFERVLVTAPSPYDHNEQLQSFAALDADDIAEDPDLAAKYAATKAAVEAQPMSEEAKRGREIFFPNSTLAQGRNLLYVAGAPPPPHLRHDGAACGSTQNAAT
jgi:hypothetical protein